MQTILVIFHLSIVIACICSIIENENNFFDDIFKDTKYTKKELKIIFDTFLKEQIAL